VTTVSRAVDDKWVQTPRGIFPLKRFFVGGTVSAAGEEVAWDAVRVKLQEIVDHENKQHPLSDDDLVKELAKHGLTVARRTVTKYRKAMDIPSSRQRRDWSLNKDDKTASPATHAADHQDPSRHIHVPDDDAGEENGKAAEIAALPAEHIAAIAPHSMSHESPGEQTAVHQSAVRQPTEEHVPAVEPHHGEASGHSKSADHPNGSHNGSTHAEHATQSGEHHPASHG
jgi:hypothetical protein